MTFLKLLQSFIITTLKVNKDKQKAASENFYVKEKLFSFWSMHGNTAVFGVLTLYAIFSR